MKTVNVNEWNRLNPVIDASCFIADISIPTPRYIRYRIEIPVYGAGIWMRYEEYMMQINGLAIMGHAAATVMDDATGLFLIESPLWEKMELMTPNTDKLVQVIEPGYYCDIHRADASLEMEYTFVPAMPGTPLTRSISTTVHLVWPQMDFRDYF